MMEEDSMMPSRSSASSSSSEGSREHRSQAASTSITILWTVFILIAIVISLLSLCLSVLNTVGFNMNPRKSYGTRSCVLCADPKESTNCCYDNSWYHILNEALAKVANSSIRNSEESHTAAAMPGFSHIISSTRSKDKSGVTAGHSLIMTTSKPGELVTSNHRADLAISNNVRRTSKGFRILHPGHYFVYSKVTALDYHDLGEPCDTELKHFLIKLNSIYPGGRDTLVKSAKTKYFIGGQPFSENESFVGGLFKLYKNDEIIVEVRGVKQTSGESEASYLGLFKI